MCHSNKPHVLLKKKSQSNHFEMVPDSSKTWLLVNGCFVSFLSLQWTWGETTSNEQLKDNSGYVMLQQHWDFDLWTLTLLTPLLFKKRYCIQRNIIHKYNTKGAFYVLCQTLKTNKIGIQLNIKWSNTGRKRNWKGRCLCRFFVVHVYDFLKGQRWGESLLENTKFVDHEFHMLVFGSAQAGV